MAIVWTPTFGAGQDVAFGSNTATFAGLTLGTGDILVCVYGGQNVSAVPTALTVAGTSATLLSTNSGGTAGIHSVWLAKGIASATGSVVLTSSGVFAVVGVSGGLLTGEDTTTVVSTSTAMPSQADPQTISASTPANGISLVFINGAAGAGNVGNPTTWSNATRDSALEWAVTTGNTGACSGAHITAAGTVTVGATGSAGNGWGFGNSVMSVTTFIPPPIASILMGGQVW